MDIVKRFLAVSLLAAVALLPQAAAAGGAPALRLVARSPVTLAGSGFFPRERVTVRFYDSGTPTARTRADRTGAFRVTFSSVTLGRCQGARARAVGARGDVALLKIPLPACMPQRSP